MANRPWPNLPGIAVRVTGFLAAALAGLVVALTITRATDGSIGNATLGRPGLLAAARVGEVVLLDPAGRIVGRASTGRIYGLAAWSHDGTRIAYEAGDPTAPDLVISDPELRELLRIPLPLGSVPRFSWSPDDRRIAFSRETLEYAEVDLVDVAAGAVPQPITDPEENARAPHWSPDGSRISVRAGFDLEHESLYVLKPDGSDLTLVSGRAGPVDQFCGGWTPDGRSLVFGTSGVGSAVWIADRDGTGLRMLTPATLGASCPSISPDGTRIAMAVVDDARRSIEVMRIDGTGLVVPDGPAWDDWPGVWSPDGRSLVVNGLAEGDLPLPRAFIDPDARSTPRTFSADGAVVVDWQRLAP